MSWGVRDAATGLWLGDDAGPAAFENEQIARLAAQMADVRLGQAANSTTAEELPGGEKRLVDSVSPKMSAEDALRKMDAGLA